MIPSAGLGSGLSGGQRSCAPVLGSFSPSGQALLIEMTFSLMVVIVVVRELALRRQSTNGCTPRVVPHTTGGFARDLARRFAPMVRCVPSAFLKSL